MAEDRYTRAIIDQVIRNAQAAVKWHQGGSVSLECGKGKTAQTFDLDAGGYCARFVRQCYETAAGITPWQWAYAAPNARGMTARLAEAGHEIKISDEMIAGDIIGIHKNAGAAGHIAILGPVVDGQRVIYENTSSDGRGAPRTPGTKVTPYTAIAHRVTGVYRLLRKADWPGAESCELEVVRHSTGLVIASYFVVDGGMHWEDQRKVYVE